MKGYKEIESKFDELVDCFISHYKKEVENWENEDTGKTRSLRGIKMYFNENLENSSYVSLKQNGLEITRQFSCLKIEFDLGENDLRMYGYLDLVGYLGKAKQAIERGVEFNKNSAEIFMQDPGKEIERTKEVIKEPDDYKEAKAKSDILDGLLSRGLNISREHNPNDNFN